MFWIIWCAVVLAYIVWDVCTYHLRSANTDYRLGYEAGRQQADEAAFNRGFNAGFDTCEELYCELDESDFADEPTL